MKRSVGVQKPDRKSRKGVKQGPEDAPLRYHPAPVLPGQTPRFTALSAETRYSDELFGRYPPPTGWTEGGFTSYQSRVPWTEDVHTLTDTGPASILGL